MRSFVGTKNFTGVLYALAQRHSSEFDQTKPECESVYTDSRSLQQKSLTTINRPIKEAGGNMHANFDVLCRIVEVGRSWDLTLLVPI